YANRHWIETTRIPDDRPTWGVFSQILERNEKVLTSAMEEARRHPAPAASAQGKVARFFASGMDLDGIEKAGLAPLAPAFARADSVTDAASLAAALAALQSRGIEGGFAIGVRPDAKRSTHYLVQLGQGGLGLPDRDYYFLEDARSEQTRAAYRRHVARMFVLAGAPEAGAEKAATEVYAVELALAGASMTNVERRDPDKTYNKMTVAELAQAAPGFPWRDYLSAFGANNLAELNVSQPAFMT